MGKNRMTSKYDEEGKQLLKKILELMVRNKTFHV